MTKAATTATTVTTIMMMLSLERTFAFDFIADAWPTFFLQAPISCHCFCDALQAPQCSLSFLRERCLARFQKQQSRRRYAANGFALSPIRAVFLDSIRWAVEPAVK